MRFSINEKKAKESIEQMDFVNVNMRSTKDSMASLISDISSCGDSYGNVRNVLVAQKDSLEILIDRLARMEDGIARAVEIYLRYENSIVSGYSDHSSTDNIQMANSSGLFGGVKDFFSHLSRWIKTGHWNEINESDRIAKDKAMANELRSLINTKKYSQEAWKKASIEERKKTLTELFKDMQSIYGVSVNDIEIKPITAPEGYTTWGYYSPTGNVIAINESVLSDPNNYKHLMQTMSHEMRHAYQHAVVNHPRKYDVDESTIKLWKDNFDKYISSDDDYQAYRDQPVEKDAREFAAWVI